MKLVPLNDKVVIVRSEAEQHTPGGIVLPDTAKEKPKRGKVVAVGDGKLLENGQRVALSVKEGQTVMFEAYGGVEVEIGTKKYVVMSEDHVLAILND